MSAQWNITALTDWVSVYVFNVTIAGGGTAQFAAAFSSGTAVGGSAGVISAINTAAAEIGTTSNSAVEINGSQFGNDSVPILQGYQALELEFPVNSWSAYFSVFSYESEENSAAFLVENNEVLTPTQVEGLIAAFADAINTLTDTTDTTFTQAVLSPSFSTSYLNWTAAATFGTGWEASGEGVDGFQFSLAENGLVYWMCDIKTKVATPGVTICDIPVAYVPATGAASFGFCQSAGSSAYPLAMQSSGTVQVNVGSPASGTRYVGSGFYPLSGV